MKNLFYAPDWEYWLSLDLVCLYEAAVLSFGVCPSAPEELLRKDETCFFTDPDLEPRFKEFSLRAGFARDEINKGSEYFKSIHYADTTPKPRYPKIALTEFQKWAESRNLKLHPDFVASLGRFKAEDRKNGVNLLIPYECEFLSKIAEIMWENFGSAGQKDPALQKNVAAQLAELTEIDLRVCTTIASKIRPTTIQRDKRGTTAKVKNS